MAKYILLDTLVAEIEKRRNKEVQWMEKQGYTEYHQGLRDGYANTISFINTLETKEVSLEEELPVSKSLTEEGVLTFKDGCQAIIKKIG